jgi:ADP-ribosylglycohydrolase/tetratricopeptide (TPR) repeat protein
MPTGPQSQDQPEPLVNRDLELDLLREHVQMVAKGAPGRSVLLLGESGVGKSRLAAEAAQTASNAGIRVVVAHCVGRGAEPLLPLKEGLAVHLGRSPERIRRMLLGASTGLLESVPFVGRFLGSLGKVFTEQGSFEAAALNGVYEELARLLIGLSEKHGLCLIVEDLHAADQDTLYFLHYLLKKIRTRRIVVISTIQEEQLAEAPPLADLLAQWTAAGDAVLTVLPLERAHVGQYAHMALATGHEVDEKLVDSLFRLSGGNPFFMKETLRLLADANAAGSISPIDEQLQLPARTEMLLRQRLARASDTTRRFLEGAAVALETAQVLDAITFVVEIDAQAALAALEEACALHLLREGSDGEISFSHDLMHRAAYGLLGVNARRHMHERAARWSEAHGQPAAAAYHFERAGDTDQMVRASLEAAARAERAGMYHSALLHYQKVRPYVEIAELGPRLGRALVVLGDWNEVEALVDLLPPGDGRVHMLRSELRFVQGDFNGSASEARQALDDPSVDRIDAMMRVADIALYLGDLTEAASWATQALEHAEQMGSANQRARCLGIVGASAFFSGRIDEGASHFSRALALVAALPDDERDRTIHATLLGNLGNVAEARGDWREAESRHGEALRLRREVADARGALQSLHALGRSRIHLGGAAEGMQLIDEAEQLARDLDEPLERAKIHHTRADLLLETGECAAAEPLATAALESFKTCSTHYDIAHALLTVSAVSARCGSERAAVEQGGRARVLVERRGYGLLRHLRPGEAFSWAPRIVAALTAYACGDALGLPWEGLPPGPRAAADVEVLRAREGWAELGWAAGATSDDTALTLLVAEHLVERSGVGDASALLAAMAEADPPVPGVGPSTTIAIEGFRTSGVLPSEGGETNGAVMRSLPVGWSLPLGADERRRELTIEMSRATHPDPRAQVAACVIAACAAWSLEGASPRLLLDVAVEEEAAAATALGIRTDLAEVLGRVAAGTWQHPAEGVGLDAGETAAAVLDCVLRATSLRDGLLRAVLLGGDTDTVAALVGGLMGSQLELAALQAELPWHTAVLLPEEATIERLATGLTALRSAQS